GKKNSNCCGGAGSRQRMVEARSCCSLARPVLGNHGSRARLWNFLLTSDTYACAIPARRNTLTVRFTRSSAKWNVLPDWRATTARQRNSTSSIVCSSRPRHLQDAALFAEMLSLPNDGRYPAVELTPQQRRQRTLEALVSQIEALARSTPVLMVFEDAHWS